MKHLIQSFMLVAIISLASCTSTTEKAITVSSPNGKLQLAFTLNEGVPNYALQLNAKAIITPSTLGYKLQNDDDLATNFTILSTENKSADQTWEQPWGETKLVTDQHNELLVHLQEKGGKERQLDIIFRLYNDGLGFRYHFPQQAQLDSVILTDELTQFTFPAEHHVWSIPVHADNSFYESIYKRHLISQTDTINTPATFEADSGLYLAIHEANLTNFASMTLRRTQANQYTSDLVPWSNGVKVYAKTPFSSPWRTVIVAEQAVDLITSTLMLNLNEPCVIADISWIKPSKYIGIWWGMHLEKYTWGEGPKHGATTENTKRYIDFAAANGFDGVLVEGWNVGWNGDWTANDNKFSFTQSYPDFNLEEVCQYGASKNVRLIGHHETGGSARNYENQLDSAFSLYQRNGVNATKTGYVNPKLDATEWHDGQYGVRHYRKVVETAARYHVMIDNHEPVKGTGLQRTYPNLMTQEGGRGQEYNAWSADGGNPPAHTATLPFTRMLAGPFDFTPGIFNFSYQTPQGARVQTTLAKQLALYVVLFSPQQMASDLIENYEGQPAFQFIKDVPSTWSQTKALNGEIGQYVTIARKHWSNDEWYLGSITNEEARTLTIPLNFLDANRTYRAEIYSDGPDAEYKTNPTATQISTQEVTSTSTLTLNLATSGGTAIRFVPSSN